MKRFLFILASTILVLGCQKEVYHNITISVNPAEGGSVSPASGPVLDETSVSFKATPKGDYVFTGWSGSISGTENPKNVTVTQDMNVTANFTLRSYPLAITIEGDGTVAERIISTKSEYQSGTVVELIATPSDHWLFDHWEGDLEGNENPAQITVSTAKNVKAVFVEKNYPLTIEIIGKGTVKEEVIATKSSYQEGTTVKLTAVPDEFWKFDHWEDGLEGTECIKEITVTGELSVRVVFTEDDPGIVFTETEYKSPEDVRKWLRLGWGLSNQLCANNGYQSVETGWGNPVINQELLFKVKEAGFSSVRVQIGFLGRIGEYPEYRIDDEWLDRIEDYVNYCETAGLNIILTNVDFDPGGMCDGNVLECEKIGVAAMNSNESEKSVQLVNSLWKQIARRFRDKGDFLIFESFNEPGSDWDWEGDVDETYFARKEQFTLLETLNQAFVDAVRSTGGCNASRWLINVGMFANPSFALYNNKIPRDYVSNNRIIQAIHFYDPFEFTHNRGEDEWGHTARTFNQNTIEHDEKYVNTLFNDIYKMYIEQGIPVFMGEIGCINKFSDRGREFQKYYMEYICKAAKTYGFAVNMHDNGICDNPLDNFCYIKHDKGEFVHNGKETIAAMKRAVDDESPEYTLQYVFDHAPFSDEGLEVVNIVDENFKQYLIANYDLNGDNEINLNEAWKILNIDITGLEVRDLTGIESFENLVELRCAGTLDWIGVKSGPGLLTSLDVSHNPRLKILQCNNNHITKIDLSNNTELEDLCIRSNGMTSLDLSHNPKLMWYDASFNEIKAIDLSENKEIRHFYHSMNELTKISGLSLLKKLEILSLNDNRLTSLDVTHNTALKELEFGNNDIESMDLSYNQVLKVLNCCGNPRLSTIYVHAGQQFDRLEKDDYTSIVYDSGADISDATFRKYMVDNFDSDGNHSLSIDEMAAITQISVCTDNIKSLKGIEYCVNLESLICKGSFDEEYTYDRYYGVLEDIDISNNFKLKHLDCSYNRIKTLNVSSNTGLLSLYCHNNLIEKLDISQNKLLETLFCRNCKLTALNVQNNNLLREIDCQGSNRISEIDISNCPEITLLNANGVGLNVINTSNNPKLSWLGCADGTFTSLNLSNNPELFCLYLSGNKKITKVDLTNNPNIQEIFARDCDNLQTIILSKGCALTNLEIDEHTQIVYE